MGRSERKIGILCSLRHLLGLQKMHIWSNTSIIKFLRLLEMPCVGFTLFVLAVLFVLVIYSACKKVVDRCGFCDKVTNSCWWFRNQWVCHECWEEHGLEERESQHYRSFGYGYGYGGYNQPYRPRAKKSEIEIEEIPCDTEDLWDTEKAYYARSQKKDKKRWSWWSGGD